MLSGDGADLRGAEGARHRVGRRGGDDRGGGSRPTDPAVAATGEPVGSFSGGAGEQDPVRIEAVHRGHLRDGHAAAGRERAERVAGAHRVAAHRLGRARGRSGGRDRAGGFRRVPAMTQPSALRPFAAANAARERPCAPRSCSASRRVRPRSPSRSRPAPRGAAAATPAAGIVRLVPAITNADGDRPLAAAIAAGERPLTAAMPERVSPGATVWTAADAVAGTRAPAIVSASRERETHGPDRPRRAPARHAEGRSLHQPARGDAPAILRADDGRTGEALAAEVALVRAQRAAVEPRRDPLGVRAPRGVRALAGPRQRARGAARRAPGDRAARAARARRLDHRARPGARARSATARSSTWA